MTASTLSLGPVLTYSQALDAWRAGAHDAALACCERLIAADPCDADALHLAGVILLGRDRAAARALLSRAAAAHETAEILVSQALALDPDEARQAQALLERALELDPACSAALNNLANLYAARRDTARASAMFERLIEQQPDNVLAHYNYGSLLVGNGASAQAIAPLRRALALDPSHTYSYINLAAALLDENQHAEALALLEHARTVQPDSALLLATLGSQQRRNGQLELARATFMRAIELDPRNAHAWNGIGNLFYEVSNIDEAQRAFARAVELKPDFSDALGNLGNIFRASGDIAQSIATYRRALELRPDNAEAHSNLTYMLAFATDDAAIIRAEAEAFCAWHEAQWLAPAVMHDNTREPARRLRIGYVSPDFREHCQRLFMTPLLAHHDHAAFEIVCYSTVMTPDAVTQQLASYADIWRDVRDYDDDRLAQQIRADGIDILVDLTMHMNGARRLVFARRPAPVQVAWLAYPGTTGSAAIGWRLTDSWLDPLGDARVDAQYTERSLRLPDAFWCYDALAPGVEVAALPAAAAAGQITFGCLNNTGKLTDATLALWSGVFAALPDARLILMAPAGSARERLAKRLAAHGIDPARVGFIGFQHRGDYLRTYSQIDIALDTVPYNGHTTSLDAFWMGVPVPTRVGRAAAGRAGLSLLANLGLQELAADSDVGYVRIVVGLARDLPRLAHLRATLRARMQASPLMDGARFAHHMEAAFRHMWNDWCAQPHGGIAAPQPAETMATVEPMEPIEPINAPLDLVRHAAALRASDDVPAAEAALLRALALDAACAPAWLALGNLLREQDRRAESEAVLRKALDHVPNDADVPNNLGTLLAEDGRHAEAQPLIERALALRPAFADAWRNLGSLFMETHRESEAIAAFQRAVELAPHVAHTHNVLAGLLMKAGETTDAIESMRAVLAHDPADESAHGDLAYATLFVTDDGAAIRAEAERFFQQHEAALYDATAQHANVRDPARRLRIGYVSPDFRNHCQSLFTLPLFANHDHAAFEIVCYASVAQPDPVTHRIVGHVDLWRDVHALDDAQIAQQVREDGIDILVDLTMHMASARRRLFAMRPAPVQVAWLAYPGTTGSPAIDWRLTDARLDPLDDPRVDAQYTERSLRLPDTFWCYAPLDEADRNMQIGALPALEAGHITFGCLNNPCKLTDATLALWSCVLAALPDARLILLAPEGSLRERLTKRLAAHGIDLARVRFVGYQKRADYLRTYAQIDIGLETVPYNGHTTSLDAFWMGVPVPTRAGRVAASRAGLSLLANLGLPELSAHDDASYVRIVTALAADLPRLAALRAGLRERMLASALMDGPRFARAMESAFRHMWHAWCAEAPRHAV